MDEGGEPIAECRVYAREVGPEARWEDVVCDERGRFTLSTRLRGPVVVVAAAGEGWSESDRHEVQLPAAEEVRLRVSTSVALEGVVLDLRGTPQAGIDIIPCLVGRYVAGVTTSDARGRFRVRLPPSIRKVDLWFGENEVQAARERPPSSMGGYVEGIERGQLNLEIVAPDLAWIEGRLVSESGEAIVGRVHIEHEHDPRYSYERCIESRQDGTFRIGPLRPGPWRIRGSSLRYGDGSVSPEQVVPAPWRGVELVCQKPR
jgi:hypothetical protein